MSMSVEQRRVEVISRQDFPTGSVRLVKASSKYDRRCRFYVVEVIDPHHRDSDDAEWFWKAVQQWSVSYPNAKEESRSFYTAAWLTIRRMGG